MDCVSHENITNQIAQKIVFNIKNKQLFDIDVSNISETLLINLIQDIILKKWIECEKNMAVLKQM